MTSIVFPGQGSQYLNMSKDFYNNYPIAKEVFEIIEDYSKINIKKIIFENNDNLLNQTKYTQISIFCASISIFKVIEKEIDLEKLNISSMLGHSLGEYTALTAAGYISIKDCALLLKIRGNLMQNSFEPNKSGMAAIIGLNCQKVEKIIHNNKLNIEIANDNSPMQVVISGINEDIIKSEICFKDNGAKKFVLLNVSSAFHSKIMKSAENKLSQHISKINFNKSTIPIISNFNSEINIDIKKIVQNLTYQMSNRVRWVESINKLKNMKENRIIEIGPGKVLSGLVKRISSDFLIDNIEYPSDINKIIK